jgi:hypothetical protein
MRKLLLISFVFVFLVSCSGTEPKSGNPSQPDKNSNNQLAEQESVPGDPIEENTPTSGPDCYGPEIHPIGQSIAEQFEEATNYDQVMVWFCNGALFDDILTALQTEKLSGTPAKDLLKMQAGGMTWDQIWKEIGLTEE